MSLLGTPYSLRGLELGSRVVRAGTSETMATDLGEVTDRLIELHETLAGNGVALNILGHAYVHPRGQYLRRQTGIHDDSMIPGLTRLVDAVHRRGGRIFAQLAHAGSQSRVPGMQALAPSPVPNALVGTIAPAARPDEIEEVLESFGAAAERAVAAGFDGVHLHGANGYLISEFSSPHANTRTDEWGGSAEARSRFFVEVVRRVRARVGPDVPVTAKIGMVDAVDGGLQLAESVERIGLLAASGLDAVEVSVGVMQLGSDSCRTYVAVDRSRARRDLLLHRWFSDGSPEAYFAEWAQAVRQAHPGLPIILVGGLRTRATLEALLAAGTCDLVAMARPLIRDPAFAGALLAGHEQPAACTSCNICLMHEGMHSLRCWRTPRYRLVHHAAVRVRRAVLGP